MMKSIVLSVLILSIAGCNALMNAKGAQQPVRLIDSKQKTYFTTCSGSVEEWGTCNQKAMRTCTNGYEILNKTENSIGGRRELTFKCH